MWKEIDSWRDDVLLWVQRNTAEAERRPQNPFAAAGLALKRILDLGASTEDLGCVAEMIAFESIFAAISTIEEGCESVEVEDENLPSWTLIETNAGGEPTGRFIDGLHEDLLNK